MSIKIAKSELQDAEVIENAVSNKIIGNGRWSISHEIIFKWKDEKHYRAYYRVGATESQDESPWEYENEVECTEVEEKQVMVTKWVEK